MNLTKVHDFDVIEADRATFAQAEALVEKANAEKIGGFTDWVLPDTQTLRALATLAPSLHWCWSSSPYVGVSNNACGVNFDNGNVYYSDRNDNDAVCLVRASQCLAIGQAGQLESMKQAGILVEQPAQQEHVALQRDVIVVNLVREGINKHRARELAEHFIVHTAPPAQRKPLTDEEIESINVRLAGSRDLARLFARAIEAAHGIKENT